MAIIDGNYFAHRFYHGRPALHGTGSQSIGMLYAFADFLDQLQYNPEISHWALALDHPAPSFRHQWYPAYKAQRPPMASDLRQQIEQLPELAHHFGITCLSVAGVEADDTIGTLACRASAAGFTVRILSCDKDLDQLLSPQIRTWDPIRQRLRGPAELWQERGIQPEQVVDWLCMVGDSADNIPGIRGIGSLGASRLLTQYGNLDEILAHQQDFSNKRQEALQAYSHRHDLIRRLVTIHTQVKEITSSCDLTTLAQPQDWDVESMRHWLHGIGLPSARFTAQRNQRPSLAMQEWIKQAQSPISLQASNDSILAHDATGLECHIPRQDWDTACEQLNAWRDQADRRIVCENSAVITQQFPPSWYGLFNDCHYCWRSTLGDGAIKGSGENLAQRHQRLQLDHPALAARYDCCYRPLLMHLHQHQERQVDAHIAHDIMQELRLLHGQIEYELRDLARNKRWHGRLQEDVRALLFDRCQLQPAYYDRHGARIDDRALTAIRHQHEAVSLVLQERQLRLRLLDLQSLCATDPPSLRWHHTVDHHHGAISCQLQGHQGIPTLDSIDSSIAQLLHAHGQEDIIHLRLQYAHLAALVADLDDPSLRQLLGCDQPWQQLASIILQRPLATISPQQSACAETLFWGHLYGSRCDVLARRCHSDAETVRTWLQLLQDHFPQAAAWRQLSTKGNPANPWPCPSPLPTIGQRLQATLSSRVSATIADMALAALTQTGAPQLILIDGDHLLWTGTPEHQQHLISLLMAHCADTLPGVRIHCGSGRNWLQAHRQSRVFSSFTPAIRMTA